MSLIISKDLNGDGAHFVNAQLEAGGFLARAVLAVRGPVKRASAPLPEGLNPGVFTSFEHGGVTSLDRTVDWLVPDVLRSSHKETLFLLIEDPWFKPSDVRDPSKEPILRLSEKNALVYALPKEQINADALKCVLSIIRSFCFTGFIIDGAASLTNLTDGISASDLAKHTKSVFVSAFDGEGVIIGNWTPRTVT